MLKVKNLTKRYGKKVALNNLSLEIKKGSIFGLLGVNGAGKTTLLSILNGLMDFDEGEVSIDGVSLKSEKRKVKSFSSIIPQHLAFYENLSVEENLEFFASIQKATKEDYEKAIEVNSLGKLLKQKASTLSGGQKRRLNIAIGLLNNPKIIYFDEPTVGVDPKSRNEILDSIKEYKKLGITVVYTSHYMSEIERICDEVAIVSDGRVVEQDTLENLLSNKVSDKVMVESVFNEKLSTLGLKLLDETTVETTQEKLFEVLELLEKHEIALKQIRYGSTNLEKHFLEITGESSV
jgi:ABC-2 type transport system ATP-binding protein